MFAGVRFKPRTSWMSTKTTSFARILQKKQVQQEETKSTQYPQKGSKRTNLRLKIFFITISQTCEVAFLNQSQVFQKAKIRLARAQPIASNKRITSRSPASWGIKKCVSIQYHLDMYKWQKKTDKGIQCTHLSSSSTIYSWF